MAESAKKPSKTLVEVYELAQVVRSGGSKKIFEWSEKNETQESSLFRHILVWQGTLSDDALQASEKLERRRYQQLLSELKQRLFEALADLEFPSERYSEYARRLFALELAVPRVLLVGHHGSAHAANEAARAWFEEALALEEWRIAISLLDPQLNWASLSGTDVEYDLLITERRRLLGLAQALEDADETAQRARMVFARSGAEHPELLGIIRPALARLEPVARQRGTFRLQEALLDLRRKVQQVTMDYEEAIAICEEMEQLLTQYSLFANLSRKSRNALSRLLCLVQMQRYEEAQTVMTASESLFDSGDQNWYSFQAWRFLLLMHTRKFNEAYDLVQTILARPDYTSQTDVTRNLWILFRGHAEYWTGRPVTGMAFKKHEKPGELHKRLMNQFPGFKGDYAGYEMAAIVLEILVLLGNNIFDFESRMESLKKYKTRHLGQDEATQSNIFIDMMQLLNTHDFERERILTSARPMLKRMLKIKTIDRMQGSQVLPYEMLWEAVEARLPPSDVVTTLIETSSNSAY